MKQIHITTHISNSKQIQTLKIKLQEAFVNLKYQVTLCNNQIVVEVEDNQIDLKIVHEAILKLSIAAEIAES